MGPIPERRVFKKISTDRITEQIRKEAPTVLILIDILKDQFGECIGYEITVKKTLLYAVRDVRVMVTAGYRGGISMVPQESGAADLTIFVHVTVVAVELFEGLPKVS